MLYWRNTRWSNPNTQRPLGCWEEGMSAGSYIKALQEGLPAFLDGLGERKDFLFMPDNAPIHVVHIVRDWFEKQDPWPAYSPDLNAIETFGLYSTNSTLT
ncbi:hypothetical protein BGX38DRAFT_1123912 [Terfezia claveryi]|nr:hypothetical protein BGX38DRAFT_1123912 [Terfezia claveryi]